MPISDDDQERMALELQRHDARELQRRLMQGLGRPIVSFLTHEGYRMVGVGSVIFWSKRWVVFTDFLLDHIQDVLGREWGAAEIAKPQEKRHPLFVWSDKVQAFFRGHASTAKNGIRSALATGAVTAYVGLAYDLYLAAHNAELPQRLLKRLRNRDQFEGAVYEAYVIGTFAKAGFDIEFEDEDDPTTSHCEFTAIHKQTKRRFSVEVKAVNSSSSRAGTTNQAPKIRGQLYAALSKAALYPRIVFVELNRAPGQTSEGRPEWFNGVVDEIRRAENEITVEGRPAPPAYVFITNRAFVHELDATASGTLWAAAGFKIDNYPPSKGAASILDIHHARQRHLEIHMLTKAMTTNGVIPTTFDDRLPEQTFGSRYDAPLLIGEEYAIPTEDSVRQTHGVLVRAIVVEAEGKAYGTYRLKDGKHVIVTTPLTDTELEQYRRSPDTFFGVVQRRSKGIKEPLDAFDFFFDAYSESSRDKLLEFMADWPDIDSLRTLDQLALAEHYCDRLATSMWLEHQRDAA